MASTTGISTAGKAAWLQGQILSSHTFNVALYTSSATNGAGTTVYAATNEISGTGYTGGGLALAGFAVATSGTTAYLTFTNPSWTSATFTAASALIFDNSDTVGPKRALLVLDFGGNQSVANGTFTIQFPAATASTALLQWN